MMVGGYCYRIYKRSKDNLDFHLVIYCITQIEGEFFRGYVVYNSRNNKKGAVNYLRRLIAYTPCDFCDLEGFAEYYPEYFI